VYPLLQHKLSWKKKRAISIQKSAKYRIAQKFRGSKFSRISWI